MLAWIAHNNSNNKLKILDYTYTSQPSINSALPLRYSTIKLIFYVIGVIASVGFLWLLVKWSNKRKSILLFKVCSLQQATHFLIQEQEVIGGSKIILRLDKFDIRTRTNCISFNYHERTYLFFEQKDAFLPIRYEELGIHLDQLHRKVFQPYSKNLRQELCQYYGPNIISLPVQTRLEVFIEEMLTPYEVFQTYAIILWIYEEYYIFALILLAYALYTYWQTSSEVVSNQVRLAKQSYFQIQCRIIANQNDNVGAINLNDETQIEKVTLSKSKNLDLKSNNSHKNQMVEQMIEPHLQFVQYDIQSNSPDKELKTFLGFHTLLNRNKIKLMQVNSQNLVPGDILILHEDDVVPCDCIILKGSILVDESYVTGQKYLTRKFELQNLTYSKQSERNFTIYLGTKIVKIKNIFNDVKADPSTKQFLVDSREIKQFSAEKQICCLVINTNYNTLRGKYLRAIRYQKKHTESLTRQTIYFIYMLIFLTTVVFFSLLGIFKQSQTPFKIFLNYLDLIFTCIPPTLPTLLSVGINFAMHRLKSYDIACVLPSNILMGGKIDTIVLQGSHALGKQYEVQSMVIGIKQNRSFGQTYPTVQKFYASHDSDLAETSSISLEETNRKIQSKNKLYQFGDFFISAISVCHGLQYFNSKIEGKPIEKKIFQYSNGRILEENVVITKNSKITIQKKIYFKQKQKILAVIASIQQLPQSYGLFKRSISTKNQRRDLSLLDEGDEGLVSCGDKQIARSIKSQNIKIKKPKKILFVKGNSQKILTNCLQETYPANCLQYIINMAENGFNLICYSYLEIQGDIKSQSQYIKLIAEKKLIFLGFLVMKQIRYHDNIEALKAFRKADISVLLVSEENQLQASSIAILNQICDKNQLLLCSFNKNKIMCKGQVEWVSTELDPLHQFLMEFQDFGKNSKLSLNSSLYEELFMRKNSQLYELIFNKAIIFNQMQFKHERNLYNQLEKRQKVSFAVGGGGIVSECANLSMELQRDQSLLLSSFHTKSRSLLTIFHCLRVCRAGLATNFHVFSMMILFSLIQFTTVCLLYSCYQSLTTSQMLYEDLFITFPIFITLNLTKPSSRLSKQRPLTSFFDAKAIVSMLSQILLQFVAQLIFLLYMMSYKEFQEQKDTAHKNYLESGDFTSSSVTVISLFILSNYLYLGVVLSTSVSKPFRKPFYTNPWYTLILVLLWIYNTMIVIFPNLTLPSIRKSNLSQNEESIVVIAMIFGNLMMALMYLQQNLLSWIWKKCKSLRLSKKLSEQDQGFPQMQMQQKQ